MEWLDIVEWFNNVWVGLVATGGIGVATIKWFVVDKIALKKQEFMLIDGEKKNLKRLDFLVNEFKTVDKDLKETKEFLNTLIKENHLKDQQIETLSNLIVQTLSVANVPLANKEAFYTSLNNISVISEKASNTLKSVIEQTKHLENQRQTNLNDSLEKLRKEG